MHLIKHRKLLTHRSTVIEVVNTSFFEAWVNQPFVFDMICMSLDMIFMSKRAVNFHPSISIKANEITSHYSGQPRTVTSSYKYAAPKKEEKANPFLIKLF